MGVNHVVKGSELTRYQNSRHVAKVLLPYSHPTTTYHNIYSWAQQYALIPSHLSSPTTINTHQKQGLLAKVSTLQSPLSKVSEKANHLPPCCVPLRGVPFINSGTTQINKHEHDYDPYHILY